MLDDTTKPLYTEPKFPYKKLNRVTNEETGVRHYDAGDGIKMASVTTILGATGDKTKLFEWKKRVGDVEAARQVKEATGIGTLMHTHLENYIMGEERPGGTNHARKLAEGMANLIIERGLKNVSEYWGVEAPVYYPGLYAGTADLIGVHHGAPAIMDFKNAKKIKKREWIEDYFLQGCAYALAHNKVYGTDIKMVSIFMAGRYDNGYKEFTIDGLEFNKFCDDWTKRVDAYFSAL